MSPFRARTASTFLAATIILFLGAKGFADIPSALEPQYSEAVLAYNGKEYEKAVNMLNALIAKEPKVVEFHELKALILKTMKDPRAIAAYRDLIQVKTAEGRPEKEIAAYRFELGQIYFEKGDYPKALESFQASKESGFNVYPSRFFTGLVYFKTGVWDQSENEFREVLRGNVEDLKPSAHFYIGQIALRTNYAPGATQSFFAARSIAKAQIDAKDTVPETRQMAQQVYDQADASLKPFNTNKFFGDVTLITGYDSNVLSVPSSQASTGGGTGAGSAKETLQAGLGYMTSPLNTWQWVPSYRGSFNYNFNQDVRNGQFMTHDFSLYATRSALEVTSWGLKLEGTYILQDQVDPDSNKGTFKPYSLTGSFGPYFHTEIAPKLILGGEADVQPGKNYLDDSVPDTFKRSGTEYIAKVYLRKETGGRWWNPGATVGLDYNTTTGTEFDSRGYVFGVVDGLHLSDITNVNLSVNFSPVTYNERQGAERNDKVLSLDGSLSYKLTQKCSLVGDIQYIDNISNITDVYQYTRLVVSAGVGYSL